MAEKILEKQVCQACGADVRRNAEFCYNCGSAVGDEADNSSKITTALDEKSIPIPIAKPEIPLTVKENLEILSKTETKTTEIKTPSAAELRQKNKLERKKSVEIIWGEPESAPNVWFLAVTFILTLFAVGILVAMLYIR